MTPHDERAEWELVTSSEGNESESEETTRLPVPGGWLYRTKVFRTDDDDREFVTALALTFVREP